MQDIVYKLVPGLQEGECQSTLCIQRVAEGAAELLFDSFSLALLSCYSGDKEAEGVLPEAGHGGSW